METHQILQSGFLDILFDGKNKLYGAYDLRKTYNQRITRALLSTLVFTGLLTLSLIISKKFVTNKPLMRIETPIMILQKITDDKPKTLPKLRTPVHLATLQVTTPQIVKDHLVPTPPPNVREIENALIGLQKIDGPKPDVGIINPPTQIIGTNVIANPTVKNRDETTFRPVEIEAKFPGGQEAWQRYIQKAIQRQLDEFSDKDYGTCMVKFQVDVNGNVSNVEATTMQGTKLAEISVNTIRKGPKWIPAMQNGRYVTAYRYQPVTLLNPNE